MKILVLTNIYPGPGMEEENTPVVHYFAREWVKAGNEVRVIHYAANFPRPMMWVASLAKKPLASYLGTAVRTTMATELEHNIDGVSVKRIPMMKYRLHAAYSKGQMEEAWEKTVQWLEKQQFRPDVVTAHWVNPQVEMMIRLKQRYGCRTCYVAHIPPYEFERIYSRECVEGMLEQVDVMGFRSMHIKRAFEKSYTLPGKTFMCYSGIPEEYLPNGAAERDFRHVSSYIFVGTLYRRKHPAAIVAALAGAYSGQPFTLTYVGQGNMEDNIRKCAQQHGVREHVKLLGRLYRREVMGQLRQSDVFIMISQEETFGLVYLEAMACGCITVASRHEGFDGIIRNGENGFLCEAGNAEELTEVIRTIRRMPPEQLQRMSQAAMDTARLLTDKAVARTYEEALNNDRQLPQ